uniref:ATP synthase complex subunit 8 n=1 Tax=Diplometopon zarudnyi TaxID=94420 RepID=Q66SX4_DIPZA|nr:ATP synthase F0 subunit 8 [Diplometopon zarudnyi]AAT08507.1 ATP synthase F0 subunit 8 [Diplometopon zarudnyi]
MPQLNPAPWLMLLMLTWTTLILYMTKTSYFTFHMYPTSQPIMKTKIYWTWPWP